MHRWPLEPRLFILYIAFLVTINASLVACEKPVEGVEGGACTKACENVARISLEDLDQRVGKNVIASKTAVRMTPEKAQEIYSQVKADCIDVCKKRGTNEKVECYRSAENSRDIEACR